MKVNIGKFYRSNKPRKVDVKIEKCDTWSLDNTLAHIVHPALLQLKTEKQGTPWVDPADAPHVERGHRDQHGESTYSSEAWDYVINEMVYAMGEIKEDLPGEFKFYSTEPADIEGLKEYRSRIANGCRLFGVYFQDLWD